MGDFIASHRGYGMPSLAAYYPFAFNPAPSVLPEGDCSKSLLLSKDPFGFVGIILLCWYQLLIPAIN